MALQQGMRQSLSVAQASTAVMPIVLMQLMLVENLDAATHQMTSSPFQMGRQYLPSEMSLQPQLPSSKRLKNLFLRRPMNLALKQP